MFDHTTSARILAIPLYPMVTDDRKIWRGESNRDYSVKSAYRICINELLDTSQLRVNGCHNLIWALKAPPIVKNFLWRIYRRCVLTCARLRDKGVDCPRICALCNYEEEDSMHIFLKCPSSQNVWSMVSFSHNVFNVVDNTDEAHLAIFHILQ
jgi:hypothetical protein